MSDCLFCAIVNGKIAARIVRQDGTTVAFEDINPQAPHHVLIVPRRHIASVADLAPDDGPLMGELLLAARAISAERGIADYRLVINCGPAAGQSVYHIHVHLLGGRVLGWPPG